MSAAFADAVFSGILIVVLYGWRGWEIAEELETVFKAFADNLVKLFEK